MLLMDNNMRLKWRRVRMDAGVALTRLAFLVKEVHVKTTSKSWYKLPTSWKDVAISNANLINEQLFLVLLGEKKNHHGFHHTSVKKLGATWRVRPSARGPSWPFGAVLSPLYTQSKKGGPRPHCLSDNWDVKPFTESSGEASNSKIKSKRKKWWRTWGDRTG